MKPDKNGNYIGKPRKCRGSAKNTNCDKLIPFPKVRCLECWEEWKIKEK